MKKDSNIKKDYLSGLTIDEICEKYNLTKQQMYSKIGNNGWSKEKKELDRKVTETAQSIIERQTLALLLNLDKYIYKKQKGLSLSENLQILRLLNDINGLKKISAEDIKNIKDIPQLVLNVINNNEISDNQKLNKLTNNETVIDV